MRKLSTTLMILGIFIFVGHFFIWIQTNKILYTISALTIASIFFFLFAHLREPIRRKWVIAGMITGGIVPVGINLKNIFDIHYGIGITLFPFSFFGGCGVEDPFLNWLHYIGLTIINIGFYAGVFNLIGYIVEKIKGGMKRGKRI